jgi:molybdopterin molybdotransferase
VLTGARIPVGADAVVSEEFVSQEDNDVLFKAFAKPGMNILPRGGDAVSGEYVLRAGHLISPEMAGLLATAGHGVVPVHRAPVVGIVGTGDELVEAGGELADGKLYASNIITLAGWCVRYKMKTRMAIVKDNEEAIYNVLKTMSGETDAMITSGGAWTGERDMIAHVLQQLGWKGLFHRIRIGPGKAAGFGTLSGKPVFILAGGPPSNLMGFLQVALPGLLSLSGHAKPGLPVIRARLASAMNDGDFDWSDFFFGSIEIEDGLPVFYPMEKRCRLSSIAKAEAVASIPEGMASVAEGSFIDVQLLKCQ